MNVTDSILDTIQVIGPLTPLRLLIALDGHFRETEVKQEVLALLCSGVIELTPDRKLVRKMEPEEIKACNAAYAGVIETADKPAKDYEQALVKLNEALSLLRAKACDPTKRFE